jgi:nucleoside-diphosphate-sugar epimerase
MKILITGGAGYIGSVIASMALQRGHQVRALDCLWFNKSIPLIHLGNPNYSFVGGDLRDDATLNKALEGIDYVIHTAAVVGDPASKLFPELTTSINRDGSIKLLEAAKRHAVKGLIFFSTCSNYGVASSLATEETPLAPLSLYAHSKVDVENYITKKLDGLDWIICRLSTVYGTSPRMRFDLTVNDFTLVAWAKKQLDIFLPESYRPYVHTYDVSNIALTLIDSFGTAKNNIYNLGFNGENYQKISIANAVRDLLPEVSINVLKEGGDKRDYQVDFSKLHRVISVTQQYNVPKAIREILPALQSGLFGDPFSPVFYNTSPTLS